MGVDWMQQPDGWCWARLGHLHIGAGGNSWSVMVEADGDSVLRGLASGRADGLTNTKAAAEAWVRDFARGLLCEVGGRDEGATLAAIRAALGCEPGGDLGEAVRELKAERDGLSDTIARHVERSEALCDALVRDGLMKAPPRPALGDVLNPADFGRGEAGVLWLAALLSEAPEGAVVRNGWGHEWRCVGCASWHTVEGVVGQQMESWQVAKRAPLTVVAWPS